MPVGFRILYRLGITPWEHETPVQVKAVAGGAATSRGHALDVGCGTGRDAVFLAEHGWTVTGIDAVPRALDAARRRSTAAGVEVRWVVGDVTRLPELETGDGHDLLLDMGCFHGLSDLGRALCATGITSVAAPGALLLIDGVPTRPTRPPASRHQPRGADASLRWGLDAPVRDSG